VCVCVSVSEGVFCPTSFSLQSALLPADTLEDPLCVRQLCGLTADPLKLAAEGAARHVTVEPFRLNNTHSLFLMFQIRSVLQAG